MLKTLSNLSPAQIKAINKIVIKTSAFSILLLIGISVIAGVLVALGEKILSRPINMGLVSFIITFAGIYIIAKLFLLRFILRPAKDFSLHLTHEKAVFKFGPYAWRWFGIVSAVVLAFGVIFAILKFKSTAIAFGFTYGAFYGATYYIILRLLKSGDAVLKEKLD